MRTYKAKCTQGFVYKDKFRHAGEVIENLSPEEVTRLTQANVAVQIIQTMSATQPDNRAIQLGKEGIRGRRKQT
jgi:hypothetical protein